MMNSFAAYQYIDEFWFSEALKATQACIMIFWEIYFFKQYRLSASPCTFNISPILSIPVSCVEHCTIEIISRKHETFSWFFFHALFNIYVSELVCLGKFIYLWRTLLCSKHFFFCYIPQWRGMHVTFSTQLDKNIFQEKFNFLYVS